MNYTAVGSLPFGGKNAVEYALDLVFKNFSDIPFWAQLPHFDKSEDMVLQFSNALPGLEFDGEKYFFDTETEIFATALEELYSDYETVLSGDTLNVPDKYKPNSCTIDEFTARLGGQKY